MTPINKFGKALKTRRTQAGLTQERAGKLLGRHQNTIARWERGEIVPDALTQEAVLARLETQSRSIS